ASIDWLSEWTGKVTSWIVLVLTFMISCEVIMRYGFSAPSKFTFDLSWMMFAALSALGLGYVILNDENVRVNILYNGWTLRAKLVVDTIMTLVVFLPVAYILVRFSIDHTAYAWAVGEVGIRGYWMPPLFPIRLIVSIGLFLAALQGISWFVRNLLTVLSRGEQ
ncbi:unnamed protein product, partial [marine sediment metagenome]